MCGLTVVLPKTGGSEACAGEEVKGSGVPNNDSGDIIGFCTDSTVARASLAISLTKGRAISGDANSRRLK